MKCPKCGLETDKSISYCPKCGAELKPRDNSSDDTLRLPDLSGVALGEPTRRRSEGGGKKSPGTSPAVFVVIGLIIAAVAAALAAFAIYRSSGFDKTPPPQVQTPDLYTDGPEDYYHEPTAEPKGGDESEPELSDGKDSEANKDGEVSGGEENDVIAEDVTPTEPESDTPPDIPEEDTSADDADAAQQSTSSQPEDSSFSQTVGSGQEGESE